MTTKNFVVKNGITTGNIVLDAATGKGYGAGLLLSLGAKSVVGIDIDEEGINEANKNKDEAGYFYIFKRCGALMGAVAGFESSDDREEAKKLVKINNNASQYFIATALNLNSQNHIG